MILRILDFSDCGWSRLSPLLLSCDYTIPLTGPDIILIILDLFVGDGNVEGP